MGEVMGGIVVEQLKRYAKRLSDNAGSSAVVQIHIWSNIFEGKQYFDSEIKASVADESGFIKPRFDTVDLRELGKAIEDYVGGNSK